jgi:hypothetical protein
VEVSPVDGTIVLDAINKIAAAPPDLLEYMRKLRAAENGG